MILTSIAAMSSNRVIGGNNQLVWNIPKDFQFFKQKTSGHIIIMGRKTYESLGEKRPLPNRKTIVVTRQKDFEEKGVIVCHSVNEAIQAAKGLIGEWPEEVFICGGEEIYRQTMNSVDKIYLTEIEKVYEGDARFPEFELQDFDLTWVEEHSEPEPFKFQLFERKKQEANS